MNLLYTITVYYLLFNLAATKSVKTLILPNIHSYLIFLHNSGSELNQSKTRSAVLLANPSPYAYVQKINFFAITGNELSTFQNLASKPADDIHEFLENVSIIVNNNFLRLTYDKIKIYYTFYLLHTSLEGALLMH